MILIDSNVFMYAAGQPHPNKRPSLAFLRRVALGHLDAVIDAEVLQEILHRYLAIGRRNDAGRVYDLARQIVPTVLPITAEHLDRTRALVVHYPRLSARDALHSAVVITAGLDAICSFDTDFDQVRTLIRRTPQQCLRRRA